MSSLSLPSPALSTPAWRIAVVGCAFSLIWSSAFIAGKQAMTGCGPFTLLSLRFLSAGALLWLLRRWLPGDTHQQAQAPASAWRHALIAGLLTNAVYLGLGYHGLRHVPAGLTAILVSTSPLITAAMAALWLHEPLGARRLLGLLCGLGGVAWIMAGRAGGSAALDDTALLGVGMILAGTLALAVSTLFNRRAASQLNPWRIARLQLLASGLVLLPPALWFEGLQLTPTPLVLASLAYQATVVSIGTTLMLLWLVRHGGAAKASSFHLLNPLFGTLLAVALLGETVTLTDLLGALPIVAGLGLVVRR
jgi:drug/metabolite transporter (DMT)-like permease